MSKISLHSKLRAVERVEQIDSFAEAKRFAKQAKISGETIDKFQKYPRFFSYLQNKSNQTRSCKVRIYRDNIYIWRGNLQTLVTVHPIPDRYKKEMEEIDNL